MPSSNDIPFVPWTEMKNEFISVWGWPNRKFQPEHVAILGPTGSGKSLLATEIVKARVSLRNSSTIIVATKPGDKTMKMGWPIIKKWPPPFGKNQVIFWPDSPKPDESAVMQREQIMEMLKDLWQKDSNTVILWDEIAYIEQELNLKTTITRYWREARALGITMVATTQRPRYVSRYMHSESVWGIAFRFSDEDDARRTAEILGSRKDYTDQILALKRHEFLIVYKTLGQAYRSRIGT